MMFLMAALDPTNVLEHTPIALATAASRGVEEADLLIVGSDREQSVRECSAASLLACATSLRGELLI